MKFGVKTFTEENFLDYFEDKADFFEVMVLEDKNYNFLKKYSKPIVIHAMHDSFGVNFADLTKLKQNKQRLNYAIKIADMVNAEKIITHPGSIRNEDCSEENSVNFYKEVNDKRILVENCPNGICDAPEKAKAFMEKTGIGLCLDINHAIHTAVGSKKDYLDMIKEFVKLNPSHYHIGGQDINKLNIHLELKKFSFDLREILKLIPKDSEITLETEVDIKKIENDLDLIRKTENDIKNKT